MATTKDKPVSARRLSSRISKLSDTINNLYQDTYKSRTDNKDNLYRITNSIEDNLDDIMTRVNNQDVSDISKLYVRAHNKAAGNATDIQRSLEDLVDSNGNILESINMNMIRQTIQSQDYQYDLICRYMSKLNDALEIKKDNVLSSDSFTKEFIHTATKRGKKDYADQFADRANMIKKKYKIEDKFEEIYWETSKYGEYFLYLVPYRKGFERMLNRKQKYDISGIHAQRRIGMESVKYKDAVGEVIWESSNITKENGFSQEFVKSCTDITDKMAVAVDFNKSGMIDTAFSQFELCNRLLDEGRRFSLTEAYFTEMANDGNSGVISLSEEKLPNFDNTGLSPDGLVNPIKSRQEKREGDLLRKDIRGAISYKIPRDQIIPLYIVDTCIGYLYLEVANNFVKGLTSVGNSYNSLMNNSDLLADEWDRQNDLLVSQISSMISDKIDAAFINSNLDLKDEIYAVLRYNDKFCSTRGVNNIKCTFLPAEDVQHFYFKMNPKTHRGISDLEDSAVPAMIWCMAYLNDSIARMSRGQDKRVYYVQQTVEKNVARTMLNVIAQLKKGNMGMRQLENMNTIFNVVGKFNDHVIPLGPNGEPPVKMEVMQGQDINTPTDLMDRMEEAALLAVEVPPEFLQTINQVDYATRFSMTNSKFMRMVFKRQNQCQNMFSITFRKYYTYEFDEEDPSISIQLPAPAFLAMTNMKDLISNAKEYAEMSVSLVVSEDEDQEVINKTVSLYARRNLATYVDFDAIEKMLTEARMLVAKEKDVSDMGDGESDMDDDY